MFNGQIHFIPRKCIHRALANRANVRLWVQMHTVRIDNNGQVRLWSFMLNYFSINTTWNSTDCCKLPRCEASYRGFPFGEIGKYRYITWYTNRIQNKPHLRSVSFSPVVFITKPWKSVLWSDLKKKPAFTIVFTMATMIGQVTSRWQCWPWPVTMVTIHENSLFIWSIKGPKLFCVLWNLLEMKSLMGLTLWRCL